MAAGARLCTVEEVEADETRGTGATLPLLHRYGLCSVLSPAVPQPGCAFDSVPVWTADDVGCTEGQHVTVIGGLQYGNGESATCAGDQEIAAVRCCADVTVGTPCTEAAAVAAVVAAASKSNSPATASAGASLRSIPWTCRL